MHNILLITVWVQDMFGMEEEKRAGRNASRNMLIPRVDTLGVA
jgi:hypothetical protein